jgi:hypothetical protein
VTDLLARLFHGPPDWLVARFDARARRAFAFWTFVAAVAGAFLWGRTVLYVTILSILALLSNFAAETPAEPEE